VLAESIFSEIQQLALRLTAGEPGEFSESAETGDAAAGASRLKNDVKPTESEGGYVAMDSGLVFSSLAMQNPKFLPLVERFIERLGEQNQVLDTALTNTDWESVSQIAHWLKGSGGSVGFHGFTDLATELETQARTENLEGVVAGIDAVKSYTGRVVRGWKETKNLRRSA